MSCCRGRLTRARFLALVLLGGGFVRADWPQFRGPTGQGTAAAVALPLEWSPEKNVAWKQAVAGAGWSSPVVSRGRLLVTAALVDATGRSALHLVCLESATGRHVWSTEVFAAADSPLVRAHERNTPASPTPIVEGDRVYVYFGHHGAACLDHATGSIIWRNPRQRFDPIPGNGGSPILAGDRLIYVAECATAPFVVALDKHTGKTLWRVPRALPPKMKFSFGAPLLIATGGREQVVIPGAGFVAALDPRDGRELWRVRYARDSTHAPRPVFAHGLVFVAAGYLRTELLAIRTDGQGDVTDTHVAWRVTKGAPLTPALVAVGEELFGVNDAGVATCWEAKTGRVHWQEKIAGAYAAAPVLAAGRIYFVNEDGLTTVVRAAREFAVLASNPLGEMTLASPAVSDGALFVRTTHHVWRIGAGLKP